MSLTIPLTVRLSSSRGDRHVTRDVRDLTMRWTDPGGYQSCQVSLDRPLIVQPTEIGYYGTLTVYDARNGLPVWEGRLEDQGRSAGADGQVWDLTAVGGRAHTQDRMVPLIYVTTEMDSRTIYQVERVKPGFQVGLGADPGDPTGERQAIVIALPEGITVTLGDLGAARYAAIWEAGMKLARVSYSWDAGGSNTDWRIQSIARTDGSFASGDTVASVNMNSSGGTSAGVVGTNWTLGRNTVDFRFHQVSGGAVKTTNDTHWASIYNVIIRTVLYSKAGSEITSGYAVNTVLASEVVADLLGRLLNQFDGANATIATTSYAINNLSYPQGTDAARVFDDLMLLEPAYTWRVWEKTSAGKYRFEWVQVPSVVRYEADVVDGYEAPGSADGLYNAVTVRWQIGQRFRSTVRTASVPELTAAGLTRQGLLDLGADIGYAADVVRAGDQWLSERRYAPNSGRLRIARRIRDLQTGRMVEPWEIRPGLIRLRGILPRVDALNATSRDGVTIMRIVGGEYRASDGAGTFELDSYAPSTARALATLQRRSTQTRH